MNSLDLDTLEELEKRATPGPWFDDLHFSPREDAALIAAARHAQGGSMSLHPKTLAALAAGPVKDETRGGWDGERYIVKHGESPRDFARRIALIAMAEEREECAKIAEDMDDPNDEFGVGPAAAAAIRRRGKP